jgi:hypothetical protein
MFRTIHGRQVTECNQDCIMFTELGVETDSASSRAIVCKFEVNQILVLCTPDVQIIVPSISQHHTLNECLCSILSAKSNPEPLPLIHHSNSIFEPTRHQSHMVQ